MMKNGIKRLESCSWYTDMDSSGNIYLGKLWYGMNSSDNIYLGRLRYDKITNGNTPMCISSGKYIHTLSFVTIRTPYRHRIGTGWRTSYFDMSRGYESHIQIPACDSLRQTQRWVARLGNTSIWLAEPKKSRITKKRTKKACSPRGWEGSLLAVWDESLNYVPSSCAEGFRFNTQPQWW